MIKKSNSQPEIDLSIIIVNYNTQFWLKKALSSLKEYVLEQTNYQMETVVVDNASTDQSLELLENDFPWVRVIPQSENRGYSVANNVALKENKARYVLLLNPDVEFTEHSNLDLLIAYLDNKPEVAVLTPRINLPSGALDPACHRGEPTLWASFCYFSGLTKLFPKSKLFNSYHLGHKSLDLVHQIEAASGAALFIRDTAMQKVGYLDERFFMYAEDLDWCKRFRDKGYLLVYHPGASVIHHKYKSGMASKSKKLVKKTSGHFYDTMLQYFDKHYANQYPKLVRNLVQLIITIKKGVT